MKLIAGMHRSGTSLVARLCHEGGGNLGDPATFHPADKWNPNGYYEQQAILDVNIALINGIWGRLSYLRLPDTDTILHRAANYKDKIIEIDRAYRGKIVKENRFCITLPAWLEHGLAIECMLICIRDPHEVARSLRRRNKIPLRLGYSLWCEHYRRLNEYSSGIKKWYVLYEDIVNAECGQIEVRAALNFLDIEIPNSKLQKLYSTNVETKILTNRWSHTDLPDETGALWRELSCKHDEQIHHISTSQKNNINAEA